MTKPMQLTAKQKSVVLFQIVTNSMVMDGEEKNKVGTEIRNYLIKSTGISIREADGIMNELAITLHKLSYEVEGNLTDHWGISDE